MASWWKGLSVTIVDKVRYVCAELAEERCPTSTPSHDLQETGVLELHDAVFEIARVAPSAGRVSGVTGSRPRQGALFRERGQRDVREQDACRMRCSAVLTPCGVRRVFELPLPPHRIEVLPCEKSASDH